MHPAFRRLFRGRQQNVKRNPLKHWIGTGLLFLALCPARPALAAGGLSEPTGRWLSLMAAQEWNRYQDDDPYRFQEATASTRSLYLSTGSTRGHLLALAVNQLQLEQEYWAHDTRRGLLLAELPLSGATLGLQAFAVRGDLDVDGRGFGISHERRWLENGPALRLQTGWQRVWIEQSVYDAVLLEQGVTDARQRELWVGALTVRDGLGKASWELGWLGQRRTGTISHALRALLRVPLWTGAVMQMHGLGGHQENWFDADRLVLHDSGQALTGMASAGLEQTLGPALRLSLGAGWERVEDHSSRWVFVGLGWHRTVWTF